MENIHELARERVEKHGERIGQAYFNAATQLDLKWADMMRTTIDDPFHDDSVLHYFLTHWHEDHPEEK